MKNYAFHPPDLYQTRWLPMIIIIKKKVPKSRHEVRKNEVLVSHPLFQESKNNCKLRLLTILNIKQLQDEIFFQYPALTTRRACPIFAGFKQQGSISDLQYLPVFFYFISVYSLLFFILIQNTLMEVACHVAFLFATFFSGNVIKELGVGCFTHKYSDSLLAINGCRFYYLSGFEFYYLL